MIHQSVVLYKKGNVIFQVQSTPKIHSPILIQDSSLEESLPKIYLNVNESKKHDKGDTPNKSGNVSIIYNIV